MDHIKKQVLDRIANGRSWTEAKGVGQAKYRIGSKIIHLRFRSSPKSDGVSYAYNINPNTLSADFEVWICGDAETYYLIPINVIKEIYNDPGAYVDKIHPDLRVADINTHTHRTLHSRLGNSKTFSSYFRGVIPIDSSSPQANIKVISSEPDQIKKLEVVIESLLVTPKAVDFNELNEVNRTLTNTYRILRDTEIARKVKILHQFRCQICGEVIYLKNGQPYAEAHHIKPLGTPHNGPDISENILCVCPNHHVQLDYGAIKIERSILRTVTGHTVGNEFVEYHNFRICSI